MTGAVIYFVFATVKARLRGCHLQTREQSKSLSVVDMDLCLGRDDSLNLDVEIRLLVGLSSTGPMLDFPLAC